MLEEVLVALAGGPEQVGTPDRQDPGVVAGSVGVLAGEVEVAGRQLLDDVLRDGLACGGGVVAEVQRVAVERRVRRHPAHPSALGDDVGGGPPCELALAGRGGQRVGTELVVAELVGVQVPERGLDHVARWPAPVQGVGDLGVAGERADLLLADVVCPTAAVDALAPGQVGEGEERAVDRVGVEPVVGPRTHHDHRPAFGLLGVLRELAADAGRCRGRDTCDRLLPGRCVRRVHVVVPRRPRAREPGTSHAVLRHQEVEDGGDQMAVHTAHRHATREVGGSSVGGVETRRPDDHRPGGRLQQGQDGVHVSELEVPPAHAGLAVAVPEGAVRDDGLAGPGVDQHGLEGGVLLGGLVGQVGGGEELPGRVLTVRDLIESDEEGKVGVGLHVVGEVRRRTVDEELLQHDVSHRHRERGVGARFGGQPLVGELHVVRVVRCDRDHLLPAVARLGHPVGVRRAGHGEVGSPHDQVAGVPPVPGLGHVGLVAEDLR